MTDRAPHVAILGAGLSGLVAALELVRRGLNVTIIEAAPFAGGRTSSWRRPDGQCTDSGLHVVADHYANLLEIIRMVEAHRNMEWWDLHSFLSRNREALVWRYARLPPPFHLLGGVMPVPWSQQVRVWHAYLEGLRLSHSDLPLLDNISYLRWLRRSGVRDPLLLQLADAAAEVSCFLNASDASAAAVISWLKFFSRNAEAAQVGTWTAPISEGLVEPLLAEIVRHGGRVVFSTAVEGFQCEGATVRNLILHRSTLFQPNFSASGVVALDPASEGSKLAVDHVISALPMQALRRISDDAFTTAAGLRNAFTLDTVSAATVRVTFDRAIEPSPVGAPVVLSGHIRNFIDWTQWEQNNNSKGKSVYGLLLSARGLRKVHGMESLIDILASEAGATVAADAAR